MPEPRPTRAPFKSATADAVARQFAGALQGVTTGLSFEGQAAQDTFNAIGTAYVPPDTNGAPGLTQYVQIVNVTIGIYDKGTGALLMTPAAIHTIWTGFGGPCELAGDGGDPVVLFDHLANRWLVTQLQYDSTGNEQCMAVSTTADATGTYNRYEYDYGAVNFPDYPKYGVWPDAYYNTANIFAGKGFAGAEACAFDRNAMLAGTAASAICFQQPSSVSSLYSGIRTNIIRWRGISASPGAPGLRRSNLILVNIEIGDGVFGFVRGQRFGALPFIMWGC
jgi:hypothetical protein